MLTSSLGKSFPKSPGSSSTFQPSPPFCTSSQCWRPSETEQKSLKGRSLCPKYPPPQTEWVNEFPSAWRERTLLMPFEGLPSGVPESLAQEKGPSGEGAVQIWLRGCPPPYPSPKARVCACLPSPLGFFTKFRFFLCRK